MYQSLRMLELNAKLINPYSSCCELTNMSEDKSKNEVKLDNDSGSLTCDVCEKTFDSMESYKEHKAAEIKDQEMAHRGVD